MKYKFLFIAAYFSIINICSAQLISMTDVDKVRVLDEQLRLNHIEYEQQHAKLEERLGREFAAVLDPGSKYLTKLEIEKLEQNVFNEMLESNEKLQSYLDSAYALLNKRYAKIEHLINNLPEVDFFEKDSVYYQMGSDTIAYASTSQELEAHWLRILKLRVLQKLSGDSLSLQSGLELNDLLRTNLSAVASAEACKLDAQIKNLDKFIVDSFMKAYAGCFDPHSDYFSSTDQEIFLSSLSSEIYSTGLLFQKQNNQFLITQIISLSDASNHDDISVGDEITAIKLENKLTPLQCLSHEEINTAFYGASLQRLQLEIRSEFDNSYRVFDLEKKHIDNISNHTFRYLLKNDSIDLGYVVFPSFYSDLIYGGKSSGQDLALILLELAKSNIDGLIVDLRNNGGGSIQEAIDLSGFFIDYGPLFMTTNRESQDGYLNKDTKRGKVFNGKVMFLVNSLSASASEMVVSAMRHYPNQLVVGAETFGKSTGQSLIPLMYPNKNESFGLAKITTLRIHEITGGSYQGSGVLPDIELPIFPSKKIIGENKYRYALQTKAVNKSFKPRQKRNLPIQELREEYNYRFESNERLKRLKLRYDSIETVLTNGFYQSLNFDDFHIINKTSEKVDKFKNSIDVISLEEDIAFKAYDDRLKKIIQKDQIIDEAFQIFKDWIELDNK